MGGGSLALCVSGREMKQDWPFVIQGELAIVDELKACPEPRLQSDRSRMGIWILGAALQRTSDSTH